MRCAWVMKFGSDESAVTTCADAKALFWLRRHTCSSWIATTPDTWITVDQHHYSWFGVSCSDHILISGRAARRPD